MYEDSEDSARASCTNPARKRTLVTSIEMIEDNDYVNKDLSGCVEQEVTVVESHQYNGGSMIDFDYKNVSANLTTPAKQN